VSTYLTIRHGKTRYIIKPLTAIHKKKEGIYQNAFWPSEGTGLVGAYAPFTENGEEMQHAQRHFKS